MLAVLMRRLHQSWLVAWLCLGIVVGTGICAFIPAGLFIGLAWPILSLSIAGICFIRRTGWMCLVILSAGIIFGVWRGSELKYDLVAYQKYYGQTIELKGLVSQDASYGNTGDQRINLQNITIGSEQLAGQVWVSANKSDIKRGDIVNVQGKLDEGFGSLSAAMYRAQIKEVSRPVPGDIARRVRDWFGAGVSKAIPEPQLSLGLGYLVGQKTALPKDLQDQIKAVGLSHAVVASGYNLTILVTFCRRLFLRVSKYIATLTSTILVMCFMLITGLSPSMTRAGLVATLSLIVWYYGRKMHPFVLLSFAASVTVLFDPSYVLGDLGWYLSFGSFVGVIVLAPLLHSYFWSPDQKASVVRSLLIETSSAQILTTPIILFSFGIFSVFALPANMLVLPFVPMAMLMTFLAGIVGLLFPSFANIAGLPATIILRYSTTVVEKIANLPDSVKEIKINLSLMLVSYFVIGAVITYLKWRTKYDFRG